MKPQSAKAKGRNLQKKIVADILTAFPHLKEDDVFSCSMGAGGEDVKMSPSARDAVPLSIEAKNQEKLNIWDAYSQASSNCPVNIAPCVIFKKNHSDTYAMLKWEILLDLFVQLRKKKNNNKVSRKVIEVLNELNSLLSVDTEEQ